MDSGSIVIQETGAFRWRQRKRGNINKENTGGGVSTGSDEKGSLSKREYAEGYRYAKVTGTDVA